MTTLSKRYQPQEVEDKWYTHWIAQGYFRSQPDEREPFSIVIPPPNVTGVLHMGHMLNNTIQDILIRKARLDGKNACWVPGMDHASIATEAKVVGMLREKGIKKSDLTRAEFLDYAWKWKEKYGGIILQQLRKLGASCDWERTAFTMDEERSKAVMKVFVDLYRKGYIYRGKRMVNWDVKAKTVLSNEEVIYGEEDASLYYVRYQVQGIDNEWITIATTRPETILGDTAIAVHPKDERYQHLVGQQALVPLLDRPIPIIADNYVDREFGTGALKITPAHDPNDYEIGLRHDLEIIDVLNPDGTMSEAAQLFIGVDRDDAQKKMAAELEAKGYLLKTEVLKHNVGRSERTQVVVEPRLSLQWFVAMQKLAEPALQAVVEDTVSFHPKKYKNIYKHWMENVRDWCISRQLWWGQRIPAWYLDVDGEEQVFVAETGEEMLAIARQETGNEALQLTDFRQDEDVVDTWFSSWLWPITVFNGFGDTADFKYYYPTSVLVTGWDIIFLWVARMIIAGYEWIDEKPFHHVYFTGMVRDQQRRKMSKSLGNSPDALGLIKTYGADGVRFGILSSSPAGGDLLFDEKLCELGRNFCNKMWNALRLVKGWESEEASEEEGMKNQLAIDWFAALLNARIIEVQQKFEQFRLSDALMTLQSLIWNDFCSWYLEMIKPPFGHGIDPCTREETYRFFEQLMILLHPFMPFITEEIWQQIAERQHGADCTVQTYPVGGASDPVVLEEVGMLKDIVVRMRELRKKYNLNKSEEINLALQASPEATHFVERKGIVPLLKKKVGAGKIVLTDTKPENSKDIVIGKLKLYINLEKELDTSAERDRLQKELDYEIGHKASVMKKLSNEKFVQNAPEAVVDKERKKLADIETKIKALEESLKHL